MSPTTRGCGSAWRTSKRGWATSRKRLGIAARRPGHTADPALHHRLSQAYAVLNQPLAALDAIERALVLSPDSVEFLRARGTLATWLARLRPSAGHLPPAEQIAAGGSRAALNLARVSAWGGRTDAAVEAYGRYLRAGPDATAVWIELASTEGVARQLRRRAGDLETYRNALRSGRGVLA